MQKKRPRRIHKSALLKAIIIFISTKILTTMRTTPLGILLIAGIVFLQAESLPASLSASIPTISYLILLFGMAITSCFNRSRFFFILLLLFISQIGITTAIPGPMDKAVALQNIFSFISCLLPLNLLFFSSLSERGILSSWGQRNFILILLQALFISILILAGEQELLLLISGKFAFLSFIPQTPLPHMAVITFFIAGILLLIKRRRATIHFKLTLFSILIAIGFAHHFRNIPIAIPLFYATAGFIIILSVIQDYYFKAYLDELTSLPSRRSLNEDMMKLDRIYVIAMVDVDFFKKFNDTYGHDAGDDVLRLIGGIMQECKGGKSFRYGGEEFTILFPGKRLAEAVPYLEELREQISNCKFAVRSETKSGKEISKKLNITVSIGVAESSHKSSNPTTVIKAADTALYRAKEQGRNCVSI